MLALFFIGLLIILVAWCKIWSQHWIRRGVVGPRPWPLVGNIAEHLLGRKTIGQVMQEIYSKYERYPYVGVFRATTPCLLVRDPDFVNRIFVKDHKSFYNNDFFIDKKADPLFGLNPFVLRDTEWKDTRQMLTPGFTSGKMKNLFGIINANACNLVKFIDMHPHKATDGIEARDLTKRFTLDNVAKSAFGIDGRCLESYKYHSEFMKLADTVLTPGSLRGILTQINALLPFVGRFLSVKLISKELERELVEIVSEVIKQRKESQAPYNDYLQFILQLADQKRLTYTDITAHGVTFFFDGYETSSNVFGSLLYNLATHPQYQNKIREEINNCEADNNGEITYENLNELKWLDACLNESLRTLPIGDILVKRCTQPYEYTTTDPEFKKMTIKLRPGDTIILPYSMLMRDAKYFENPQAFYPERMLNSNIDKSVFFPFGNGPRVCIGQRFGQMQIKMGAALILKNFSLSVSSKMKLPIEIVPFNIMNEVRGGIWLNLTKLIHNV